MIRRLLPPLLGLLLVVALTLLRIADPYPVQVLREIAFDFYQRLQPRADGDFPVRVVDIDEDSLAELGQWPWTRDRLAELSDRLTELGAAAVAFDALFPEPDRMSPSRIAAALPGVDPANLPDYDAIFATSLANSPSILGFSRAPAGKPITGQPKGGFAISGPDPKDSIPFLTGVATPLAPLRDSAHGFAALSLNTSQQLSWDNAVAQTKAAHTAGSANRQKLHDAMATNRMAPSPRGGTPVASMTKA